MKPNVIFVDDEQAVHIIIKHMFRLEEEKKLYNILCFLSGEECLEYIKSHRPNDSTIIFSDICMPVMDGIKLAQEVKLVSPNLPFNFMSALDKDMIEHKIDSFHATSFFQKPVQFEKVKGEIKTFLTSLSDKLS